MWFPWSLQNVYVYIVSFILNTYSGFLCTLSYAGFQSTITILVGQIVRQLRILTFILGNMNQMVFEMVPENNDKRIKCCSEILKQTVVHYIRIKRFSNRLNVICQPFFLAFIIVGLGIFCVCTVKVAISDKLAIDTMQYYLHVNSVVLMTLMFSVLGQLLENESQKLEEAATEQWYLYDIRHMKDLRIFHMALGQRMPIYIFGSIRLDLSTFTWYIKTGMSFFTLVMSVIEF